jgi:hypothetical protein
MHWCCQSMSWCLWSLPCTCRSSTRWCYWIWTLPCTSRSRWSTRWWCWSLPCTCRSICSTMWCCVWWYIWPQQTISVIDSKAAQAQINR